MRLRILSANAVRQAITMREAIEVVKSAFAQLAAGEAVVPDRLAVRVEPHNGTSLFMPAYVRKSDQLGAKVVSVYPDNLAAGLPTILALMLVIDASTGAPIAIMDGSVLTALRTGAASGAATDLLARRDSHVVAIIGSGAQGRTQLEAVCAVREITEARAYDTRPDALERFVREMGGSGPGVPKHIIAAASASEAVRGADIICTATTSYTPVFSDDQLSPGTHINAVGAFAEGMQEIPEQTIVRSKLVVDSLASCLGDRVGDLLIPLEKGLLRREDIHGELGDLVRASRAGRTSASEITVFKTVGNAVEDVSVAHAILARAEEQGLGTLVEL